MTTPHQGPGMWQQGNREQALDWLANLDPRQQQALQRSIQTHQALAPIYNATNRVIQSAQRTAARLSDYAQRLASGARTLGQNAVAAGQTAVDRTVEGGQEAAARLTEMGQRGRDNVAGAAEWTAAAATGVAYRAIDGATAAGRGIADAGRQVAAAGRQAVAAGQNAVGKVSRWFKEKQTNTSVRANAARAAFQAFRTDPALQNTVSPKDVKVLSEQAAAIGTAKNWDELNAAIQQFGQSAERLGGQTPQATAAEKANNPAWALQGTTHPRGAVTQTPATAQASAQVQQNQGEAAKQTGGKHRAGPETER
ncbi:hypothetical protein EV138_5009 [Kribbella voronezhensis]|uniref:Uncharacterized protein n=1 Tax=Kribbella voronezhensis TaxID=2512212 RepID=A0A4V3FKS9_9ACTN|nr:hypothetical protein [Kribbella voronezhensis]TDU91403.1 hypothetical protein EV138_5009 [Kribbella voronezhensis]